VWVSKRFCHDLNDFQSFAQKAHSRVNFAQPLLPVDVVAIFRTIAISRGRAHCFGDLGSLYLPQGV
jgi:hypothetical protein